MFDNNPMFESFLGEMPPSSPPEDVHMLEVFNDNRKKKQAALAAGSQKMWKELLEEEKQLLQK